MEVPRQLSIGAIIDQLLADHLIDACHITYDQVTIVQGTKRHTFPHGKAHTFLKGMLRGRSWHTEAPSMDRDAPVSPLRAVDKTRRAGNGALGRRLDLALEELLAMAEELRLITGHRRDEEGGPVTIALTACEAQLEAEDAVAFLAECILYKLNAMRLDAVRQAPASHDGSGNSPAAPSPRAGAAR